MGRAPRNGGWFGLSPIEVAAMLAIAVLVLTASYRGWWSMGVDEAWGFATGGICVWLVVREHVFTWPVGLANNVFFFVLFLESRLYADMSLQVVYFGLGVYGWWNWLFGGVRHGRLVVGRATRREWFAVAAAIPFGTWALREVLIQVNGAAPFFDALTTVLSLVAQYLMCRKRIETWWFWIAADIVYVPLYLSRSLPLTAILYAVFLTMCIVGMFAWRDTLRREALAA